MKIAIINGPNLNLLGYPRTRNLWQTDFRRFSKGLKEKYPDVQIDYFQSNVEGELVNEIQRVGFNMMGFC